MRFRRFRQVSTFVGVALALAGTSFAFAPNDESRALEFPLAYEATPVLFESVIVEDARQQTSAVLGRGWTTQKNPRTGMLHMAYGANVKLASAVAGEAQAADAARNFLLAHSLELGTSPNNIELRNVVHARGKYAVHYRQIEHGIRVWRASAFVLMGEGGELVAFGSDFFPYSPHVLEPALLSESDAIDIAVSALGATPRADRPVEAETYLVPAPSGELMLLTRAYRVVFETNDPLGKWATFVDARTGALLGRENRYHFLNVTGNVDGDVQDFGYCEGNGVQAMSDMTVNVQGGNSDVTDLNGDYDISHGGTSPVTVTAQLLGPFINVNFVSGADASFSGSATPGTPFQISWDGSNSRQDERNVFFHQARAHQFVKALEASFVGLDYAMPASVANTGGICPGNAWWDGNGTNFCSPGSGYGNTGNMGNVIYHEYGHGLSQELYQAHGSNLPSGDMHEGNSDVFANFLDRNSVIGYGFYLNNCDSGIRNADNNLQWPADNDGGHFGGQIIAGFHWDSWQSMLAAMPQAQADAAAWDAWHYARAMGTPLNQASQVLWTFMADDDDADLTNGTPNYDHFCLGASNHGFNCPTVTSGIFVTHTPLTHTTDGTLGFDIDAVITSTEASLDPALLLVRYRVNGGSFTDVTMTATGNPDEYSGHIPALGQTSEVEYYVTATDMAGNTQESPATAPGQLHAFDVAYLHDDLEGGVAGWTAGLPSDDATTGEWEAADPIGTGAQPEDDSTPSPGTICFITGQCSGPNCGGGCSLGCNDIDNGTTTLLSPVYDLNGSTTAKIKYDRWYSNDTGAEPGQDSWVVDVSNDGGSSWTNVENTMISSAKWNSITVDLNALFGSADQVQLRFRASDLLPGSLVEAAVDEVRILAAFGGVVGVDEPMGAAPISLTLSQNQPNPFRPSTRIEYGIPTKSDVNLTVYNVNGQVVRSLATGPRDAGRYHVNWDGRDAGGQRVAAGVYFYRLAADGKVVTKKMTVMQ